MPLVEKRYAKSLMDLCVENKSVVTCQQELGEIADIYINNNEFRDFLQNPQNHNQSKKEMIKKLFDGKIDKFVLNLLYLLLDKDRIGCLPVISSEFGALADEFNSIINIIIYTPEKLEGNSVDAICNKFQKLYNTKGVRHTVEIDKSLIGGVKVQVGDRLYDGTIKGKLSRLQSVLMG